MDCILVLRSSPGKQNPSASTARRWEAGSTQHLTHSVFRETIEVLDVVLKWI
jgi:hypothetical protein